MVHTFASGATIPAHGHCLLVHAGKNVGVTPDATFTASIGRTGGSLALRFSVTVTMPLPDGTVLANDDYGVGCAQGVSAAGPAVTTTVTNRLFLPLILRSYVR